MRRHLPPSPLIEPLESRIAPASIVLTGPPGQPLLYSDKSAVNPKTGQPYLQFINAADPTLKGANLAIADTVGRSPDVFFIKVSTGEDVKIYTPSVGYQDLVNVAQGNVVAFFTDPGANASDPVYATQITGVALGTKVSVAIGASVNGDIVTDYNDLTGTLGGASEAPGSATQLLANTVTSLAVDGSVHGIYAGGNISRLYVSGTVTDLFTGTAASGSTLMLDSAPTGTNTFTPNVTLNVPLPAAKVAGPSLSNAVIGTAGTIHLGTGGAGAAGGGISGLTLLSQGSITSLTQTDMNGNPVQDGTSLTVIAGNGGAGALGRTAGGAGGSISGVVFNGPTAAQSPITFISNPIAGEPATVSVDYPTPVTIVLDGGTGGSGLGTAKGGAGGAVQHVYVDYTAQNANDQSPFTLADNVTVQGGAGGSGGTAGAGGGASDINFYVSTLHLTANVAPELQILGGAGGDSTLGGKGGAGGAVTNTLVYDTALPQPDSSGANPDDTYSFSPTNVVALIEAGAGGFADVKGAGGVGGAVSGLTLKGFNFEVISGAGGDGISSGGAGGGISTVTVEGSSGQLPGDSYHVQSLVLTTGAGGNGAAGKGGAGGNLTTLTIDNSDFGTTHLDLTTFNQDANGFQITTGNGGRGREHLQYPGEQHRFPDGLASAGQ
jgi:hypothetical protein